MTSYSTKRIAHHRNMMVFMMTFPLVVFGLVLGTFFISNTRDRQIGAAQNITKTQLINYLSTLSNSGGSGKKMIAGQHVGQTSNYRVADRGTGLIEDMAGVMGGDYVGMVGADLGGGSSFDTGLSNYLIDYWNKGGLVTVSWHRKNPATNGTEKDRSVNPIPSILASGSNDTKTRYYQQLDSAAESLKRLKDNGVIVLYRPFHEMTINAFWWGCQDQTQYKQLWQTEYNYLTNTKGLNNLVWVWNPHRSHSCTSKPHLSFYPGSTYVDIVGADAYECINSTTKVWGGSGLKSIYDQLITLGKPVAFPEVGESRSSCRLGTYSDYRSIINSIKTQYPRVAYFIVWNADMSYKYNDQLVNGTWTSRAALNDPVLVARGEAPIFSFPTPSPKPSPTPSPTPSPKPSPTPPPPIVVPDANPDRPVKIPSQIPVEKDGTIIADFTGDGLNEKVKDLNNDGKIDPKTEIIVNGRDDKSLTNATMSSLNPEQQSELQTDVETSKNNENNSNPGVVTIDAGPFPEARIPMPVAYTFVAAGSVSTVGIGMYLAVTKLAIFTNLRIRLGL